MDKIMSRRDDIMNMAGNIMGFAGVMGKPMNPAMAIKQAQDFFRAADDLFPDEPGSEFMSPEAGQIQVCDKPVDLRV